MKKFTTDLMFSRQVSDGLRLGQHLNREFLAHIRG
jgi:hypothetical protein